MRKISLAVISATNHSHGLMLLKRHQKWHQRMITHTCDNCRKAFHRRDKLAEHQIHCQGNPLKRKRDEDDTSPTPKKVRVDVQVGEGEPKNHIEEEDGNPCNSTTAFEGSLKKVELKPRKDQKQDMSRFLRGKTKPILNHLSKELRVNHYDFVALHSMWIIF